MGGRIGLYTKETAALEHDLKSKGRWVYVSGTEFGLARILNCLLLPTTTLH